VDPKRGQLDYLGRADQADQDPRAPHRARRDRRPALRQHPAIDAAGWSTSTTSAWFAYLVGRDRAEPGGTAWVPRPATCRTTWCQRHLAVLDSLPTTSSGKLDRRALPAHPTFGPTAGYVPAEKNPVETALAGIWGGRGSVCRGWGVQDNFFELGGDSILSIQIISRAGPASRAWC